MFKENLHFLSSLPKVGARGEEERDEQHFLIQVGVF